MEVSFYGAYWCKDCIRAKRIFDENNIPYLYYNIEDNPLLAEKVVAFNEQAGFGSKRRIPVIIIGDRILSEPSNEDLIAELQQAGLL